MSSIDCNIPVFLCNNKNGVSRMIKSQVFLPLSIIRTAGAVELASDGTTLFLKRMCRFTGRNSILRQQLKDVFLLESIIENL